MMNRSLNNFIGQLVVCLLIAINTYPTTQNIMADLWDVSINSIAICTMSGLKYVSSDLSKNSDVDQDTLQTMEDCPFCQGHSLTFIPPTNQNDLGNKAAYSERFKISQYRNAYYKTTRSHLQTRDPPIISFT